MGLFYTELQAEPLKLPYTGENKQTLGVQKNKDMQKKSAPYNTTRVARQPASVDEVFKTLCSFSPDKKWSKKELAQADSYLNTLPYTCIRDQAGNSLIANALSAQMYSLALLIIEKMPYEDYIVCIYAAALYGNLEVIQAVIGKIPLDEVNDLLNFQDSASGATALLVSLQHPQLEIACELIKKMNKTGLKLANNRGITPLILAASKGYTKVVKALVSKLSSEDLNAQENSLKVTALLAALENKHYDIGLILIDKMNGIGLKLADNSGLTPLIVAAIQGYTNVVKTLISKFSQEDLNVQDSKYKCTALMWALNYQNSKMALELIKSMNKRGLMLADIDGNTPLTIATQNGYTDVVALLNKRLASKS